MYQFECSSLSDRVNGKPMRGFSFRYVLLTNAYRAYLVLDYFDLRNYVSDFFISSSGDSVGELGMADSRVTLRPP